MNNYAYTEIVRNETILEHFNHSSVEQAYIDYMLYRQVLEISDGKVCAVLSELEFSV